MFIRNDSRRECQILRRDDGDLCHEKIYEVFIGRRLERLCKGLLLNIACSNQPGHTILDGYDFAQEGIVFLCEHYGKKLNDLLYIDKHGKHISVKKACLRVISRAIGRKLTGYHRHMNIDELYDIAAPEFLSVDLDRDITDDDYAAVDNIIKIL